MLDTISPQEAKQLLNSGAAAIIDIRDTDEYLEMSISGAFSIPITILEKSPLPVAATYIFTCSSGNRTTKYSDLLSKKVEPALQLAGGTKGYAEAGLPVNRGQVVISMFRQIQIVTGIMILGGVLGSYVWPPAIVLSGLVGFGLTFAGITDFCGLKMVLAKMPWNQRQLPIT